MKDATALMVISLLTRSHQVPDGRHPEYPALEQSRPEQRVASVARPGKVEITAKE
jgi:hypothetical protein